MADSHNFIAPKIIRQFSHAAAGHEGVLRDESGALLIKPCLPKEIAFYESAALHPEFAKWMPTYMGTLQMGDKAGHLIGRNPSVSPVPAVAPMPTLPEVDENNTATSATAVVAKNSLEQSIVLSNLTYRFVKPCVLDVKLGAQLWDDAASQEKRDRLDKVSNKTTSKSLGLRIAGMKVWKGTSYQVYDKLYGRTFDENSAVEGFTEYLSGAIDEMQRKFLAKRFQEKVEEVQRVLENQESRMYSASLLFVYEGDPDALKEAIEVEKVVVPKKSEADSNDESEEEEAEEDEEEEEEEENVKKIEDLKLIDFAHAEWTLGKGPDENSLYGVRNAAALFKKVAEGA